MFKDMIKKAIRKASTLFKEIGIIPTIIVEDMELIAEAVIVAPTNRTYSFLLTLSQIEIR